jgi:hypothetical protein
MGRSTAVATIAIAWCHIYVARGICPVFTVLVPVLGVSRGDARFSKFLMAPCSMLNVLGVACFTTRQPVVRDRMLCVECSAASQPRSELHGELQIHPPTHPPTHRPTDPPTHRQYFTKLKAATDTAQHLHPRSHTHHLAPELPALPAQVHPM